MNSAANEELIAAAVSVLNPHAGGGTVIGRQLDTFSAPTLARAPTSPTP